MMWLWGKVQGWAAWLGIIAFAIGVAFIKGRKAGIEHIEAEQGRRRDALQAKYDEIDSRGLGVDDAYSRLRKRSSDRNVP